jgi:hypothetical protein
MFFDQNDCSGGAYFLEQLFESYIEDSWKKEYSGECLYHLPFDVGEGLCMEYNPNSTYDKPKLSIDDLNFSDELNKEIMNVLQQGQDLLERVRSLEKMHSEDGDHFPPIISTKEQYEEMKDTFDKERKVLVKTTFDRAMDVL